MKIGIITFHRANNYGAVLQTCAIAQILKNMGCAAEIIDYRKSVIERFYLPSEMPKLRKNLLLWLRLFCRWKRNSKAVSARNKNFDLFRCRYLSMSESCCEGHVNKSLLERKYDIIVTGSDQIWSASITKGIDEMYCYQRVSRECMVISYAASIGDVNDIFGHEERLKEILKYYDAVSVRENSLYQILKKEGISCALAVDPTLLIGTAYWMQWVREREDKSNPYIMYYDAWENETSAELARKIAQQKKMRVYYYNKTLTGIKRGCCVEGEGPEGFVNHIFHAEMVVSSSFHAICFAILFQKQFFAVLTSDTDCRVKDLLDKLQLSDRIIRNIRESNEEEMYRTIDYKAVYEILDEWKKESMTFLRECLDICLKREKQGNTGRVK